jgi:PAS domain S-box-containing protein
MFASASQNANEDVDLHDIFAEYFSEDYALSDSFMNGNTQQAPQHQQQQPQQQHQQQQLYNALAHQQLAANAAAAAAQSGSVAGQQQLSLPTGQGIKTAWHAGALPSMKQHQQGGGTVNQGGAIQRQYQQQQAEQQPPSKRLRGEELLLPGSNPLQQQQQQQQPHPQQNQQRHQYDERAGQISHQQQLALAHAAAGVGGLSSRLGFAPGTAVSVGGSIIKPTMPLSQEQQQPQQQQVVLPTGSLNLPVGMGLKFGAGGISIGGGAVPLGVGGNAAANNDVMNAMAINHAAALALSRGGFGIPQSTNANNIDGIPTAVSNIQYGANPAYGLFQQQQQQQQMVAGVINDGSADERRLRNREHAKRSRVRKKFMLESLQQQVKGLQAENSTLRMLVQQHIPQDAMMIIDKCCSKSVLFGGGSRRSGDSEDDRPRAQDAGGDGDPGATPLLRSDFSLIESLTSGQQNFVLSDPRLPDNPIVYATPGFYELTGYTREQVLGRNCRFLQGAGTDRRAVEVVRTAVANGTDATVCLLNYKADGTPFWNQLFVAALRDSDDCIVNYVSL